AASRRSTRVFAITRPPRSRSCTGPAANVVSKAILARSIRFPACHPPGPPPPAGAVGNPEDLADDAARKGGKPGFPGIRRPRRPTFDLADHHSVTCANGLGPLRNLQRRWRYAVRRKRLAGLDPGADAGAGDSDLRSASSFLGFSLGAGSLPEISSP